MPKTESVTEDCAPLLVPVSSGEFLTEFPSKNKDARTYPKFDGTCFENPFPTWMVPSFKRALAFSCSRAGPSFTRRLEPPEVLDVKLPVKKVNFKEKTPSSSLEVTWIGHATVLVRMDGISIITDPLFSDYCAPVISSSLRRFRAPPCSIDELPDDLGLVLISHNHYDHLDYQSIVKIYRRYGNKVTFCVPKGLGAWFRSNISGLRTSKNVVELTWWQAANFELNNQQIGKNFQVVSVPAQHWSLRHPFNRNRSLWCGYVVIGPSGRKFYFVGDTGYCSVFKEIGTELGPIDLSAIPIGAYKPRDFLQPQHINPFEAADLHLEVQSKKSVAIHWGTFRLGNEDTLEPKSDLAQAASERNIPPDSFVTICHGETLLV